MMEIDPDSIFLNKDYKKKEKKPDVVWLDEKSIFQELFEKYDQLDVKPIIKNVKFDNTEDAEEDPSIATVIGIEFSF